MKVFRFTLFFFILLGGCTEFLFAKTPGSKTDLGIEKALLSNSFHTPGLPLPPADNLTEEGTGLSNPSPSGSLLLAVKMDPKNKSPKAHAGSYPNLRDENGDGQEAIQLDGSKSRDQDGRIVSYSWSIEGSITVLATGVNPTVEFPVGSTWVVLTVTDNGGLTDSQKVKIMVKEGKGNGGNGNDEEKEDEGDDEDNDDDQEEEEKNEDDEDENEEDDDDDDGDEEDENEEDAPVNTAPVAHAGPDQQKTDTDRDGKESIILDGSGSKDPDGRIEQYSWKLDGNEIASGMTPTVELPTGTTTLSLTVTDDAGASASDEVAITIMEGEPEIEEPENTAPTANAGEDQELTDADGDGMELVQLNGTGSTDEDGQITSYSWRIEGSETELATGVNPTVELPVGSTTIQLIVTDDGELTHTDAVQIIIKESPVTEENEEADDEPETGGGEEGSGDQGETGSDGETGETEEGEEEGTEEDETGGEAGNQDETDNEEGTGSEEEEEGSEAGTDGDGETGTDEETEGDGETIEEGGNEEEKEEEADEAEGDEDTGGEVGIAFLPNLFSPNRDQMNDVFTLEATHVEKVHLRIFNRQGRLVYETRDVVEATENGWDGTAFGEPQPAGTYVWILEGSYTDGSPILIDGEVKGNVTLIR